MRTLVVHPEAMTAKLLRFLLTESGHEVVLLKRAEQCLRAVRERETDAVLLTVALPDRDGFALCQELRKQRYSGPVIVLTPQEATSEKLRAFAAGADDVIGEPFDPAELVVRLEAISRRCRPLEQQALGTVLTVGEAELSLSDLLFRVGDQEPVPLTPTELRLLECLMRNQGIIIGRQRLTERIWGRTPLGRAIGSTSMFDESGRRLSGIPTTRPISRRSGGLAIAFRRPRPQLSLAGGGSVGLVPELLAYRIRSCRNWAYSLGGKGRVHGDNHWQTGADRSGGAADCGRLRRNQTGTAWPDQAHGADPWGSADVGFSRACLRGRAAMLAYTLEWQPAIPLGERLLSARSGTDQPD